MKKFEPGKTYSAPSLCDSQCIFSFEILKRTAKTVTINAHGKVVTRRIFSDYYSHEAFRPFGNHSMAVVISANLTA